MTIFRACTVCGALSEGVRCSRHVQRTKRPSATRRGYGVRWRAERVRYLAAFPICQDPEGCLEPAVDVHHRDGLGPRGPRGYDWANLQGLCRSHHAKLTAAEKPAGWAA